MAAQSDRGSANAKGITSWTLAAIALGAVGAAWLEVGAFAGYLAAALAAGAFGLLNRLPPPVRFAAALSALGSPFLVLQGGEDGLLWSSAAAFVLLATSSIAGGLRRRLVESLGRALLGVLYLSLLGSHLILIREFPEGAPMVTTFVLMSAAYLGASVLVERHLAHGPNSGGFWAGWKSAAAGLAAAEGVAFVARSLIGLPIGPTGMAILALVVAAAAAAGRAIGGLAASVVAGSEPAGEPGAVGYLTAGLLAVPAFYYGFRLYLA